MTEQVLDVPIRAVVGGLHLPVHAARTPLVPQAVLGNPHPPWQPISERDAGHVLEQIEARGPRVIALSGHDSTPGPMTRSAAASPTATAPCGPARNCGSPRRTAEPPARRTSLRPAPGPVPA